MSNHALIPSDLCQLAEQINQEHRLCEASMREGLTHAIKAGDLLIQAKELCPHGEWGEWLRDNCEVSERTAQAYMRVARGLPMLEAKAQHVADLSFRDAVKLLAEPTPYESMEAKAEFLERRGDDENVPVLERLRALNELRGICLAYPTIGARVVLGDDEQAELSRCEAVIAAGLPEANKVFDALEKSVAIMCKEFWSTEDMAFMDKAAVDAIMGIISGEVADDDLDQFLILLSALNASLKRPLVLGKLLSLRGMSDDERDKILARAGIQEATE